MSTFSNRRKILYAPIGPAPVWTGTDVETTPVPIPASGQFVAPLNELPPTFAASHRTYSITKNTLNIPDYVTLGSHDGNLSKKQFDVKRWKLLESISHLTAGWELDSHWQLAATFRRTKKFKSVIALFPACHIEIAKDHRALHDYCTKGDDFFVIDHRVGSGKRVDIDVLRESASKGISSALMWKHHYDIMIHHHKGYVTSCNELRPVRNSWTKGFFLYGSQNLGKFFNQLL